MRKGVAQRAKEVLSLRSRAGIYALRSATVIAASAGLWVIFNQGIDHSVGKAATGVDPCSVALTPHAGHDRIDKQIQRLQQQVNALPAVDSLLEKLGWQYVAKARVSGSPRFYSLAEQTALCIDKRRPGSLAGMLLRGHVLHNLHRFKEAELVARELTKRRESFYDWGLLGDALMEQGRLEEAQAAYQRMANLKPGVESYTRSAHLRWLFGDLRGATTLMQMAAEAAGSRSGEPAAWSYTRLSLYRLQAGQTAEALKATGTASAIQPNYAPALLARGRILLAEGRISEAVKTLSETLPLNPSIEMLWLYADALRADGQGPKANRIEERIRRNAELEDPRTFALFLATRGEQSLRAVELSEKELAQRQDPFTYDALAWALHAAGKNREAASAAERALSTGVQDARLFLHTGIILKAAGRDADAAQWLQRAHSIQQMLFPSELERLSSAQAAARMELSGVVTPRVGRTP